MASWRDKLALTAQRNRQEIVKAKLSRREMVRAGLITASGSLVLKSGLSSRAYAALTDPDTRPSPASPPVRPWLQDMPMLTIKQPVDYHDMLGGPPDGTTPIDGATKRINHQYCSYDPNTGVYGGKFPPKKFYELTAQEGPHQFHPDYAPTTVWGFDGLVPGPNIQARYGEPIMVRFHNHLPSVKTPQNFGIAEITTHLHNAHTPSESDGNPVNYFNSVNDPNSVNPLGFKDQHYPNVLAGFTKNDPNTATNPVGNPTESLSSLWYHDHHLDYTAQNVYKGMFGCYNLFDDKDTGDETTGLRLPSGKYDVPIFFSDPLFDRSGQLVFDLFNLDGILGDKRAANGVIQPKFTVDRRRYRFRLYAPGPSRWWEFALWDKAANKYYPFWQISSDGNLLPHSVQVQSVRIGVAERADVVIDFSQFPSLKNLYLVNILEQFNGRGPTGNLLSTPEELIRFDLGSSTVADKSLDPAYYADPAQYKGGGNHTMRDLPDDMNTLLAKINDGKTPQRTFVFERGNGAWQVNGQLFDENVVSAKCKMGGDPANGVDGEIWTLKNGGGSWSHPVHIHYEEHRTLTRNGKTVTPGTQVNGSIGYARKDVIALAPNEEVKIFMRFRDMTGPYVMHCHNVVHEDHAMMVRWDIVPP